MKQTVLRSLVFLTIVILPVTVSAETVVRTADTVTITQDQTVESDLYAAARTISLSGTVQGDMYGLGGSVTQNGLIEADFTAIAGRTHLSATVTDDVRIVAGETVLAGEVGGDVFVIGGMLTVLSTASIVGDIFFFGGEAEINGPVGGSIMGSIERLRVDSSVAGSIDVTSTRGIVLGDRAQIAGDVQYKSITELTRSPNAVVEGSIVRGSAGEESASLSLRQLLTPFLILLFGALMLYLLARKLLFVLVQTVCTQPARTSLVGLGLLLFVPFVIVVLLVTVLGVLVGVGLFGVFLALSLLAYMAIPAVFGALLGKLFTKQYTVNPLLILCGAILYHGLLFVPILGLLVAVFAWFSVLGALAILAWRFMAIRQ